MNDLEKKFAKIKDSSERMRIILLECKYEMILNHHNNDEDIIHALDSWLSDWLYKKDNCPNCGNTCEDYDVEEY